MLLACYPAQWRSSPTMTEVVLLTKRRYILIGGSTVLYKGRIYARRDYCKFAKDASALTCAGGFFFGTVPDGKRVNLVMQTAGTFPR